MAEHPDYDKRNARTASTDKGSSRFARASAARLMAVQAAYQLMYSRSSVNAVIEDFLYQRAGNNLGDDVEAMPPDGALFSAIVRGVQNDYQRLDEIIEAHSGKHWRELDALLHATLRCFAYEVIHHNEIDAPILITDYIEVTKAFYDRDEARLVNGIADAMARDMRQ
jgi:N utilization substance protein B